MYYKVKAKCGHVGRNNYIEKDFFVKAESGREAAFKVRHLPRVKHDRKDAIIFVETISYDEYLYGVKCSRDDKYFLVTDSTTQRLSAAVDESEIQREDKHNEIKRTRNVEFVMRRQKIMEKQYKKMILEAAYA